VARAGTGVWDYFTSPAVVVAVVVGVEEGGGGEDGRLHGWTRVFGQLTRTAVSGSVWWTGAVGWAG
jgi:hypothetical protein